MWYYESFGFLARPKHTSNTLNKLIPMAIDAYSQCPGATGKKIKFCCPDFLPELEKIDRMIEGEQYTACIKHIEHLREQPANHDRQCLLAHQAMLLRITGQLEAAEEIAAAFLEKYPANQAALSESTILAAMKKDYQAAMSFLQRAVAEAKGSWSWRTFQAAQVLAESFISEAKWVPARALLQFLLVVDRQNKNIAQMVSELFRSPGVPLLLKEDPRFPQPSADAPWANKLGQAASPMIYGDWMTTEKNLTALLEEVKDVPEILRSLATVRGWLGDTKGCIEALQNYAKCDIPLEDAVEAQATAMLLSESPLGDVVPVMSVGWTIKDVDAVQEAILSDARIKPIPFDPASMISDDSAPPKTVGIIFDRQAVESLDGLTAQAMPVMLGQVFLYGRQTDREARLEVLGITANEVPLIKTMFAAIAGQWLFEEKTQELTATSITEDMLHPQWGPIMGVKPNQYHSLLSEFRRDVILNKWPAVKLGVLDGLTPQEAASDAKYRVKVLAAILVLQYYVEMSRGVFDLNELRQQLGLPTLEPIETEPGKINILPLIRLARVVTEKLSDDDLVQAFHRAVGYSYRVAVLKFGQEIIKRHSFAGRTELALAYMTLARMEEDLDKAMNYIASGRNATEASGQSHAMWDLEELSLRFARQEIPEALQLIRHIESNHINEPNVSLVLTQILIDAGLLRPDGTPAFPSHLPESEAMGFGPQEEEPGKLWTPDSESSGGGGSKLWVPD